MSGVTILLRPCAVFALGRRWGDDNTSREACVRSRQSDTAPHVTHVVTVVGAHGA